MMKRPTKNTSMMHRCCGGCVDALQSVVQKATSNAGAVFVEYGALLIVDANNEELGIIILLFGVLMITELLMSNVIHETKRPPLLKREDGPWKIQHFHDGEIRSNVSDLTLLPSCIDYMECYIGLIKFLWVEECKASSISFLVNKHSCICSRETTAPPNYR